MSELFPDYRPSWETDQHRELRKHAAAFFGKVQYGGGKGGRP